jgi:hypothetical protein
MTDSKHLHKAAVTLRRKMQAKVHDADLASLRVAAHNSSGDFARASTENGLAIKYYNEALKMEYQALELENDAMGLEGKAADIDRKESEIQKKCNEQIEQLEKQKKSLLGS